ncbi:MAG TPA: 3-hydroxyacyl-CoA dehydrogenase NAD-binding domain-containing protein [Steroidobacteraceae bacterium]|nr:enoyl-CoA hydratase/isomerase family protein [Steroidobacteraceae bacterium]HQW08140.1 3-hydroxyacyl-CoA dehydrogenase NAD-binding domain-containing protein [Steroidobacteraceae bacterium]HQX79415.1 3-hydroxyacyl-CoA dehydrogenase NAD-binding domain-containing protein [Steroidobacteraceae bacterium]
MSATSYEKRGKVAVITMMSPPVNGLGAALRAGLIKALDKALGSPGVKAIVLTGSGSGFSAGADIREFNSPKAAAPPTLHTLIAAFEASPKPVVAAIHGTCMGGGLELALGCHYRVTKPDAQIALPEVKIGLIPGAGGTQRLPRALGLEAALNMIVSGNVVPAQKLAGTPLFDEVAEGELLPTAVMFAERLIREKRPPKRVRDLKVQHANPEGFLMFARNTVKAVAGPFPAPVKCVEAVTAAASQPFAEGLATEQRLFHEILLSPQSRALRHIFFGERAAAKIPDVPETTLPRPIAKAAVIGAGTMGGGITMNFVNAGIPVTLLEMKQEALDRGLATIRGNYGGAVKKGRMTEADVEARMQLITPALDYAAIAQADIVIEAVFEDMEVKKSVFGKLDTVMKPGAILATNTSTLDVDRIAGFTQRPGDVIGTHFFSPANVMRLLEVVRGAKTAPDVLATVMKLGKRMKKIAVVSGVCDGFIGNRMLEQLGRQMLFLLEEGALPKQVDAAMEKFGFAMGPFRVADLAGNDIGWAIRKRRYVEKPLMIYSRLADRLCEQGRFGQKTGAGWYDYKAGDRTAHPSTVVEQMVVGYSQEIGVKRRVVSEEEIVDRIVFALVNEGAKILEEGIALRASDIDMVYLNGYGFPAHRGGPMLYADTVGLDVVVRRMKQFARNRHGDPAAWAPARSLVKLAAAGKTFS